LKKSKSDLKRRQIKYFRKFPYNMHKKYGRLKQTFEGSLRNKVKKQSIQQRKAFLTVSPGILL
jgi:hypothetical protein